MSAPGRCPHRHTTEFAPDRSYAPWAYTLIFKNYCRRGMYILTQKLLWEFDYVGTQQRDGCYTWSTRGLALGVAMQTLSVHVWTRAR